MNFFRNKKIIFAGLSFFLLFLFAQIETASANHNDHLLGEIPGATSEDLHNLQVNPDGTWLLPDGRVLGNGEIIETGVDVGQGDYIIIQESGLAEVHRANGGIELWQNGELVSGQAPPPGGQTDSDTCSLFKGAAGLTACARDTFGFISVVLIWIAGLILWVAAQIFEILLQISIVNFSSIASSPGVIAAWGAIRDLSNIFFIFILLYIAIGTILDLSNIDAQKMVTRLVIVALLINFSMPITRVIIDSGNILSLWLYRQIAPEGLSINERIMTAVNPAKLVDLPGTNLAADFLELDRPTLGDDSVADIANEKNISVWDVIVNGLGATIVILVLAFTFFAAGFMFLARTVWLVLLIIVSPFAYFLEAFPQGAKFAPSLIGQFWDKLLNQTFFAPVYLALLWISFQLITSSEITQIFSVDGVTGNYMSRTATETLGPIIYFIFVVALLIASLISAGEMGAAGAGYFKKLGNKWQKQLRGEIGRGTVGAASFRLANSKLIRGFAGSKVGGALGGRALQRGLDAGANLSFADGKNYKTAREEAIKTTADRDIRAATDQKTGEVDLQSLENIASNRKSFFTTQPAHIRDAVGKKVGKELTGAKTKKRSGQIFDTTLGSGGEWRDKNDAEKEAEKKAQEALLKNITAGIQEGSNLVDSPPSSIPSTGPFADPTMFDAATPPATGYVPNSKFFDRWNKLQKDQKTILDKLENKEDKK